MGVLFSVLLLLLAACQGGGKDVPAAGAAIALTDDAGHTVQLTAPAQRVISLVPSVTETIIALGAGNRIVARTEYDRDTALAAVPLVGRGLSPSVEGIIALRPDLVVVWASDKRGDLRGQLEKAKIPVLAFEVQDTTDAYRVVSVMGKALGRQAAGDRLMDSLRASLKETASIAAKRSRRRVFYVVYNDPPMTAGPGTFIDQLLDIAGADNVFSDATSKWPTVSLEEVVKRDPDIVVLPVGEMSAQVGDRLKATAGWRDLRAVKNNCLALIDADLVNRPGTNVAVAARRLEVLLHDETCPVP
ncbi:MAG TPA: ABC transporter substrate-binding protein [Candidatus Limnocylindria bacterium]|nr:ABC transporter substrate-binding protein [Candidatus Limnocylindria bacterium]